MKRFKQLIYLFALIGACGMFYVAGHNNGYDLGFDSGVETMQQSIIYENLIPESLHDVEQVIKERNESINN
jgi:hypothetical protein